MWNLHQENGITVLGDQSSSGLDMFGDVTNTPGALESRYAMATGALKVLAEQQGLDCAYEHKR